VPKNEDGEFELILGNRQLLSVFFIVIVLFALFFVMGYILGRPVPATPEATTARKTEKQLVVESPAHDTNPPATRKGEPESAPEKAQSAPPEKAGPAPEKAKHQEAAKADPPKAEPPKVAKNEPKPEPVKTPPPETKAAKPAPPPPAPAPAPAGKEPASGAYLQLAATSEREANLEAEKLRKKGFKTVVAEIPEKHGTFRVLVGPLSDASLSKTKADLSASGFPGDKAIKRSY